MHFLSLRMLDILVALTNAIDHLFPQIYMSSEGGFSICLFIFWVNFLFSCSHTILLKFMVEMKNALSCFCKYA